MVIHTIREDYLKMEFNKTIRIFLGLEILSLLVWGIPSTGCVKYLYMEKELIPASGMEEGVLDLGDHINVEFLYITLQCIHTKNLLPRHTLQNLLLS